MGILDHNAPSAGAPRRGAFGVDWSSWLPPVTSRTLLSHYLPASGAVSHTLYTVHLFSPTIITKVFPTADLAVSNTILFNANVGLGFYVYFRRHLQRVEPWDRVEFSVFSSTLFNFGSLLAAVLIKALIPTKTPTWAKSALAASLSIFLLSRACKYMTFVDGRGSRHSPSPPRSPRSHGRAAVGSAQQSPASVASTSARRPNVAGDVVGTVDAQRINHHNYQTHHDNAATDMATPPMTTTNYSITDLTPSVDDFGDASSSSAGPNFRYLHSYALNNLNNANRERDNIIRRTDQRQGMQKPYATATSTSTSMTTTSPIRVVDSSVFVTPSPSIDSRAPSRLQAASLTRDSVPSVEQPQEPMTTPRRRPKTCKTKRRRRARADDDDGGFLSGKTLDLVQWHAPLLLIPTTFAYFVWCNALLPSPVLHTLRFAFQPHV